ncbi:MAG TPA: hypothetical protein VLT33_12405 [Labilithrix sp.]|nr:hypothetical protein [Labilithrix sp.]
MRPTPVAVAVLVAAALACGQDDDPEGARVLWEKVNAGPGFQSWQRAPGFPTRKPSFTAHANAVEIFVSPEVGGVLGTKLVTEWPVGSIVVKEGYSGSSRRLVAIMEKRSDGWFWAEYDGGGTVKYSGRPAICIDCHDNRKSYSDWVYSFELPR